MSITQKAWSWVSYKQSVISLNNLFNVAGIARSILALGTLLTLLLNDVNVTFSPAGHDMTKEPDFFLCEFCLFHFFSLSNLYIAKIICVACLIAVVVGIHPKITGLFHWYVSFSYLNSSIMNDGGDQITAVLTLMLIPICILDKRKNHWNLNYKHSVSDLEFIVLLSISWIIKLQIVLLYIEASTSKLKVKEWYDGTALYYWFNQPDFGLISPLLNFANKLFQHKQILQGMTWFVLLLELLIGIAVLFPLKHRKRAFIAGVTFHFCTIIAHGLASFFLAMTGALTLAMFLNKTLIKNKE